MKTVTAFDAERWLVWLRTKKAAGGQGLAAATVGRSIKHAKQFFGAAVRRAVIRVNPFASIKAPGQINTARNFFVDRASTSAVLKACPDPEWQLLFALSRYGGLRCPSEHLALKWEDVNWAQERMRVCAPKTEHLEDGGERWVPIFPELRPFLDAAWERAKPGAVFVVSRYRDTAVNLRTQMLRIIHRAGLKPWPRLFQNLRASRETELAKDWPLHVVCEWIGNSAKVAADHYLQVTEEDYRRAAHAATSERKRSAAVGQAKNSSAALREAGENGGNGGRPNSRPSSKTPENTEDFQNASADCSGLQLSGLGPAGFEPATKGL